jgi:hypothetical protein
MFHQLLLSLILYKPFPVYLLYLLGFYFHPFPLSLSSLATSLNFFCVLLSSFVKSSSIYFSPFLSQLTLISIMFFFCSELSIFTSTILSFFILNAFFTFSFTPISLFNYSSTPISIFPIFSSIIFILSIQSAFRLPFLFSSSSLSLPLILSLAPPSPQYCRS